MRNCVCETEEFCQFEMFKAQCSKSEVVMMTMANYGRMRVGKCISEDEEAGLVQDYKYIGCYSDVLNILHKKCSLQNKCELAIPNVELDKTSVCLSGLKLYLQARYDCLQAMNAESSCRVKTSHRGKHLTSLYKGHCGHASEPWLIEADRGQRIKVKVISVTKDDVSEGMVCGGVLGHVVEAGESRRNVSVCRKGGMMLNEGSAEKGGGGKEDRWVGVRRDDGYISRGNRLEVYLNGWKKREWGEQKFSISFEADGCSDIIPHEDSWLKRDNDDLVVGCFSSPQKWYLRCENRQWTGVLGNCSRVQAAIGDNAAKEVHDEKPESGEVVQKVIVLKKEEQVVVLAALCALGVIICLAIVCFGCICFKKWGSSACDNSTHNKQPPTYYSNAQYSQPLFNNQPINNYPTIGNNNTPHDNDLNKEDDNKYFVLEADK